MSPIHRLLLTAALISASHAVPGAEEVQDDRSYRTLLSTGIGRFTGDYGSDDKTTLDVLSVNARWYFDRAELQVSVPYLRVKGDADVQFIDGQPVATGIDTGAGEQRSESGLGDVVLRGEYYLSTGSETRPWIIGLVRVKLPTGSESRGLGSGATDVETGIGLIQRHGRVSWLADAGYIFVGNSSGIATDNEVRLGGGASIPFGEAGRRSSYIYFENRTHRFDGPDRRSIALGLSTDMTQSRRLRLSASLFFGLSNSSEDVGLYFTLGHRS